ncbi:MAG: tRNA (adenosine(37)-N6)-dimethylallyltransferase MiaA [SAR324 cluster bacterium]|nr:tRNA (adenosine(37)-N6)-dimethylallyltransferase MiaA [SAR324 cluster bacterium]
MSEKNLPKIIAVVGPTASGKSELALYLAQALGGEIICTDSMQVYQKMDIGTAKPTAAEQALIPHHQLDLVKPDAHYSAGCYERDVGNILKRLHKQNKPAILVGGTGLYFRCTVFGICQIPEIPPEIKEEVNAWHEQGLGKCFEKLQELDPVSSSKLHKNDTARILRALEVVLHTGQSIQSYQQEHGFKTPKYSVFSVAYRHERENLYHLINQRTHVMLNAGLVEEVRALLEEYPPTLIPLQAIGYFQVVQYLENRMKIEEMVEKIQQKTRNYAKRQLNWFKNDEEIRWFSYGEKKPILNQVKSFLDS